MSSAQGFPDWQRITQWLGPPIVTETGRVIGAGTITDGPYQVSNFASVIVALKATGGAVTVTIKQTVPAGPASLVLTESVVVPAGATLFEAFVLFGGAVELDLTGAIAGTSVDYALYGSNTTTNAQVITSATINVQQNEVLIAAEPTLDFVDAAGFVWGITDDAPNTRVKIVPPTRDAVRIADVLLAAPAAAIDFQNIPAIYSHLLLVSDLRTNDATNVLFPLLRFNADAAADYDYQYMDAQGAAFAAGETLAASGLPCGIAVGSVGAANWFGKSMALIPNYLGGANAVGMFAFGNGRYNVTAGTGPLYYMGGTWRASAAVNRLTIVSSVGGNFIANSRATLYGLR